MSSATAYLDLGQKVANTGGSLRDEKEQEKSKAAYVHIASGLLIQFTSTFCSGAFAPHGLPKGTCAGKLHKSDNGIW